ncbi:MAG TPA: transketolase C-terminal domain-containing protein [Opitutaceae bacterium]
MRDAFARTITELGRRDGRLVLLSGDIGNRMFDRFKEYRPRHFYNCGVAEANMVSVAAGLAMSGLRPWVYTIASFLTYRPFEQIRVDVACHHLPVVLVGTGAGLCYASNGPTHHAVEDIALYRVLPGFTIACPADAHEVVACMRELQETTGPAYLRLGKKGEPKVHAEPPACPVGKARPMLPGCHAALLATGNILSEAVAACDLLRARGFEVALWHFPWVLPLDEDVLAEIFARFPLVLTVEEHSIDGGFGSLVAEWRAEKVETPGRLLRCGIPRRFIHETTEQHHARRLCGIDAAGLTARIEAALAGASFGAAANA